MLNCFLWVYYLKEPCAVRIACWILREVFLVYKMLPNLTSRLINNSIMNNKKKPISKTSLLKFEAWKIINYYNSIAHGLLSYFRCVDNFNIIKKIVTYHIRYSLLRTLAHKHKCTSTKILAIYGKKIESTWKHNKRISFISSIEVSSMKKDFLITEIKDPYITISKSFLHF